MSEIQKKQEQVEELSIKQYKEIDDILFKIRNKVNNNNYNDFIRICNWLGNKLDLCIKANQQDILRQKDTNKYHPIRPRKGDIYVAELGENIGGEISSRHLIVVIQNNSINTYGNTVIVAPISSSLKYSKTHIIINNEDIKNGRLDKLPSKVKTEQIKHIDKARLVKKIAELNNDTMEKITKIINKNIDS